MQAIGNKSSRLYFLDTLPFESTGKNFLILLILATIRSHNKIALAIATSGIWPTLLDGSRTAHSALKLLLNLQNTKTPTCNIIRNSGMGTTLQTCEYIVWNECTMTHKKALEALDRTPKNLKENEQFFRGALILLSRNFW